MARDAWLNDDQRKLVTDLLNTMAKLFLGGGFVAPFLGQIVLAPWIAVLAISVGVVLHLAALYIAREKEPDTHE